MKVLQKLKNTFSNKQNQEEENDNIFYSFFIFGLHNSNPIWDWENWQKVIPHLEPIINLSSGTVLIKSTQSIPKINGNNVSYGSNLRFGRMEWNLKNNEKWTSKYSKEEKWTFFDTEFSFPPRSHFAKNPGDPEIFITVQNCNLSESKDSFINQSICINISKKIISKKDSQSLPIKKIAELFNSKLIGQIERPALYKGQFGYTDSYWDGHHGMVNFQTKDFNQVWYERGLKKLQVTQL